MSSNKYAVMNDKGLLEINLHSVFYSLPEEHKRSFIKDLALQPDIVAMVTDYICGEDKEGLWTSEEPELRHKILARIEAAHIKDFTVMGPRYGWRAWDEIQRKLKNIHNTKEIYWALQHDDILGSDAYNFFKRHNIESNFTTKQADADIQEVKDLIKQAFSEMKI